MTVALCDRFRALSPFSVQRERFCDVVELFIDLQSEIGRKNKENTPPEGSFKIGNTLYKPAQNDDWY